MPRQLDMATRRESALLIHRMGTLLKIPQYCINSAIFYMHRYFTLHSFHGPATMYWKNFSSARMCVACLFLAAKVEDLVVPAKSVIGVYLHITSDKGWLTQEVGRNQLMDYEDHLLSTLGFQHLKIKHQYLRMKDMCKRLNFGHDLCFASHHLLTNCFQLTALCVMYKPSAILCVILNTALKLHNYASPSSKDKRPWHSHFDNTLTSNLLEKLTDEFLHSILDCPYKSEVLGWVSRANGNTSSALAGSQNALVLPARRDTKPDTSMAAPRRTGIGALGTSDQSKSAPSSCSSRRHATESQSARAPLLQTNGRLDAKASLSFEKTANKQDRHFASAASRDHGQRKRQRTSTMSTGSEKVKQRRHE